MRKEDIKSCIDVSQENVDINKFPNAEADEMRHYASYHLEKDRPDNVIIVSGLNDLLHHPDRENADSKAIGDKVLNIGRLAKEKGVARICISGLVKPRYYNCRSSVDKINAYLRDMCTREGYIFIDQSNIESKDLGDSIHVGNNGMRKLKANIFKELFTYTYSSFTSDWLGTGETDQQSNDNGATNVDISLKEYRTKNSENLIIGSLNINSLRNKVDQLRLLVKDTIDILIIQETKLDETFPDGQFMIEGFMPQIRRDRNRFGEGYWFI